MAIKNLMKKIVSIIYVLLFANLLSAQVLISADYPALTDLKTVAQGASLSQEIAGQLADTLIVNSVADLALAIQSSDRHIIMTPGDYQMTDYMTPSQISITPLDAANRAAMLDFSGSNNSFDFSGVTIFVDASILNDFGKYIIEISFSGDNNIIKDLTLTDVGTDATASGGTSVAIDGDNVRLEGVTLNVSGSSPYGYGDLLGKGDTRLVTMRKHSGMLVSGLNDTIVDCTIISRSFGHLFFVQGGRNIHFEGCYAESMIRHTSDMLAETSGTLFDLDFACIYNNLDGEKFIPPGYAKSMSECGYRTYGAGGTGGFTTGAVSASNCIAKNTRIGFAFTKVNEEMFVENCQAIGCEAGYNITSCDLINCSGDATTGPLLYINSGDACTVDLTLNNDTSSIILRAIACIVGSDHHITFNAENDTIRPQEQPINLGISRPSACNPFSAYGSSSTSGVTLINNTHMPVLLDSNTSKCKVTSNGVVTNQGSSNTVVNL